MIKPAAVYKTKKIDIGPSLTSLVAEGWRTKRCICRKACEILVWPRFPGGKHFEECPKNR